MDSFVSDEFKVSRKVSVGRSATSGGQSNRSLLLSLLFFLPFVPFLGFAIALRNFMRGDRRLGVALACLLGALVTAGQLFSAFRAYQFVDDIKAAPQGVMQAGFDGDVTTFGEPFGGSTGATMFIDTLRDRYGAFVAFELDDDRRGAIIASPGAPRPYRARFERASLPAHAGFELEMQPGSDWLTTKLTYIAIQDDEQGDVVFTASDSLWLAQHPG